MTQIIIMNIILFSIYKTGNNGEYRYCKMLCPKQIFDKCLFNQFALFYYILWILFLLLSATYLPLSIGSHIPVSARDFFKKDFLPTEKWELIKMLQWYKVCLYVLVLEDGNSFVYVCIFSYIYIRRLHRCKFCNSSRYQSPKFWR